MKSKLALALLAIVGLCAHAGAQQWLAQNTGTKASLRGLSVVNRNIVWASGSRGTYLRTTNGGRTWHAAKVSGAEELDFRGVKAFDANTAVLMSSGPAEQGRARIYRTEDGGAHWSLAYETKVKGAFLDCMAFWDREHGIAVGDPVDGKFWVIVTEDGGKTWKEISGPDALPGDGVFAASNSGVAVEGSRNAWFVTGGAVEARVFRSSDRGRTWQVAPVPVQAGTASAGLFSVAFRDTGHGVAVGGDYQRATASKTTAAFTEDGGRSWKLAASPVAGLFLSGVAWIGAKRLVAVGSAGWAESRDDGRSWTKGGDEGFNVVAVGGRKVWAAGSEGRVSSFKFQVSR